MVNFIFHKISFLLVIGRQDKPLKPISSLSPTFPVLITRFLHEDTYIGHIWKQGPAGVPTDFRLSIFESRRVLNIPTIGHPRERLMALCVPSFSLSRRNQQPIHSTRSGIYCRYWSLISAKENDRNPCIRISDPVFVAQKFHFNPARQMQK